MVSGLLRIEAIKAGLFKQAANDNFSSLIDMKMTFLEAAYIVLLTADRAMNAKEIVEKISELKLWVGKGTPKEKSPSKMLERQTKGEDNLICRINKNGKYYYFITDRSYAVDFATR